MKACPGGDADADEEGDHTAAAQSQALDVDDGDVDLVPGTPGSAEVGARIGEIEQLGGGHRTGGTGALQKRAQLDADPADPRRPLAHPLGDEPRLPGRDRVPVGGLRTR